MLQGDIIQWCRYILLFMPKSLQSFELDFGNHSETRYSSSLDMFERYCQGWSKGCDQGCRERRTQPQILPVVSWKSLTHFPHCQLRRAFLIHSSSAIHSKLFGNVACYQQKLTNVAMVAVNRYQSNNNGGVRRTAPTVSVNEVGEYYYYQILLS